MDQPLGHRYIPNSTPGTMERVLAELGISDVEELYADIPKEIRYRGELDIPRSMSEQAVGRVVSAVLAKNRTTSDLLTFLGAGCWLHHIPAACDEITSRSEFLSAYTGSEATDHGKYQAAFEFQSMIGDLLEMDVVGMVAYDGCTASGDAVLMASRITGRHELLVPETMSRDRLATIKLYCEPFLQIKAVGFDRRTGRMDLGDLKSKVSHDTAAVYIENPTYLGVIETNCDEIAHTTHEVGALLIAHVNPITLGILNPPGAFGADIACGEGQPLGIHPSCGGSTLGLLACRGEENLISAMPTFLVALTTTSSPGERGFSRYALFDRLVFSARDRAKSFTGTSSWLWAISAAVYLSLLGPRGIHQLGLVNMQKAEYAMQVLGNVHGLRAPIFSSAHFNEFVVDFGQAGKSVREVNEALLDVGILGGRDISREFPSFGNSALYCVTELHDRADIERLAVALEKIVA